MGSIGTIMFALSLQSDSLSNRTCDSLWTWRSCFWSGGLGSWQDIAVNARLGLVCILSGLCCSVEWKERRGRERRGEEEKGEKSGDFFERCNTNLLVKDVNCIQLLDHETRWERGQSHLLVLVRGQWLFSTWVWHHRGQWDSHQSECLSLQEP